jgi:glycosyltransferase involved in cell wall biosynthesis
MPRLYAALDLYCLSSTGESFPQVVGEAMACGVPCVVTDVGDAAEIVGQTGMVVAPGQPEALASACARLLRLPESERCQMGEQARGRIREKYNLAGAVARFAELYEQVSYSR